MIWDGRISEPTSFDSPTDRANAVVGVYKQEGGVLGYFLGDEYDPFHSNLDNPKHHPGSFAFFRDVVATIRNSDPARITYINLLPRGLGPYLPGSDLDYIHYVEECIKQVKPHFLSFDFYPQQNDPHRHTFSNNLRIFRDVCVAHGQPFWAYVDAFPPRPDANRYPAGCTTEHLRWQAIESVRYRANGIMYFTYWQPPRGWGYDDTAPLVSWDGTLMPRYHEVKKLNDDLRVLTNRNAEVLFGRVRDNTKVTSGY